MRIRLSRIVFSCSLLSLACLSPQAAFAQGELAHYNGTSGGVDERFGSAVAGLGDVNGDGLSDIAVGAYRHNSERGVVRVFSGLDGSLLYSLTGAHQGDRFGWSIAGVGDANGDGIPDLAVGAPEDGVGPLFTGTVSLYSGSDGALLRAWHGDDFADSLGTSVAGAGDIDGDGLPDLVAGMVGDDSQGLMTGAVRAYSYANGQLLTVLGKATQNWMGSAVAQAGDVNGDGHGDFWCGAKYSDEGASSGGAVYLVSGADGSFMYTVTGEQSHDRLGTSIAAAFDSDVDGDRLPDMLSGADQQGTSLPGQARVFSSNSARASTWCTAKINSAGCVPAISWSGSPGLSAGEPFTIEAHEVINQQFGIFFYGYAAGDLPFQGGVLCVAAPLVRTAVQNSGGSGSGLSDCSGTYAFEMNSLIQSGADAQLSVGQEVFGQFWSRDPGDRFGTGLTDAVRFTIQP